MDADWRAHHGWFAENVSMVDVAQLVRVPDCDSGCRGFESHHPPHFLKGMANSRLAVAMALTPCPLPQAGEGE